MNNTIFDDVFRTMVEKIPQLAIPLINEVFQTAYPENVEMVQLRNEHHQENGEIITDSCLRLGRKLLIFLHQNKNLKKDTLGTFSEVSFFNTQPINFSFTYSNPRRFTVSANRSPTMPSFLKRRIAFSMTAITSSSSVKILVRA